MIVPSGGFHAGVYLKDLINKETPRIDLFNPISAADIQKTEQFISVQDAIHKNTVALSYT